MKFLIVIGCVTACVSAAPFYGLVAHPNGAVVPADEPAVAAARAEHLSAKGVVAHAAYAAPAVAHGYTGPLNLNTQLIGHPNGAVVPVDEPAVAAAPVAHAAYAAVPAVPAVAPAHYGL